MKTAHLDAITVTQSPNVWQLNRNGQPLAVIERAWDDLSWFVFFADANGELAFQGAYGRIVTLKACLRLWARNLTEAIAPPFHGDEQPE